MYKVVIVDMDSTQENPVKPVELLVSVENLSECISTNTNDHCYAMVAPIKTFK